MCSCKMITNCSSFCLRHVALGSIANTAIGATAIQSLLNRRTFNVGQGVAQSQCSRTLIFYQEENGLICHHSLLQILPVLSHASCSLKLEPVR